jgi:hypothetical protein
MRNLARGGIVLNPTLAMVGEKGPEAVIPLDQLPRLMGGAGRDERGRLGGANAVRQQLVPPGSQQSMLGALMNMGGPSRQQMLQKMGAMGAGPQGPPPVMPPAGPGLGAPPTPGMPGAPPGLGTPPAPGVPGSDFPSQLAPSQLAQMQQMQQQMQQNPAAMQQLMQMMMQQGRPRPPLGTPPAPGQPGSDFPSRLA